MFQRRIDTAACVWESNFFFFKKNLFLRIFPLNNALRDRDGKSLQYGNNGYCKKICNQINFFKKKSPHHSHSAFSVMTFVLADDNVEGGYFWLATRKAALFVQVSHKSFCHEKPVFLSLRLTLFCAYQVVLPIRSSTTSTR